jgi:hypothetical protein
VHIDHEYFNNNEPWPIEIEDHDGNLHAVNLEPGQVGTRPNSIVRIKITG